MRIGFTFGRSVLFSLLLSGVVSGVSAGFALAADAKANESSASTPRLLANSLPASALLDSWPMFTSEVGKFKVAMPSIPAAYRFSSELEATDSLMFMQMQLTDATHLEIYAAAFIEIPEFDEHADIESILLSCVTSLSNADLQSVPRAISLGDYQGLEAKFQDERGLSQVSRCYFAGDRTYLLTASSEPFDAGSGLIPLSDTSLVAEMSESILSQSATSGAGESSSESSSSHHSSSDDSSSDDSNKLSQSMEAFFRSFEILESENSDS